MENADTSTCSLEEAKSSFLNILSKVDPSESGRFAEWVMQHCASFYINGNTGETTNDTLTWTETRLKKIVKDIKRRIPLQGIMESENICPSEEGKVQ